MHKRKKQYKKDLIAVILVMILVFTAVVPIKAMNEMQGAEENTEVEQLTETKASTETQDNDEIKQNTESKEIDEQVEQNTEDQENKNLNIASKKESKTDAQKIEDDSEKEGSVARALGLQLYSSNEKTSFDINFDNSILPSTPGSGDNEWQIIRGSYQGSYKKGEDVSSGFDTKANVSYSKDNAVRLTKNVISTDTENEFKMYLNVEPQVSWEEILQLNTIKISNNNRGISPPAWPEGGQNSAYFSPIKTGNYTTPVNFKYYAMENGKKIVLADVTMYSSVVKVPNGGIGIGNPLLRADGGTFYAHNNFDLKTKNGETATVEIDISTVYAKYEFSTKKVQAQKVQDQVSNLTKVYESSLNYDGGSCELNGKVLNWTLPEKDLGLLPYEQDSNGNVTPVGVKRSLSNGKTTYYRQEAYQMSYKFSLDVQDSSFVSATSKNSKNDISAEYAVQTNQTPGDSSKENGGKVTYKTDGVTGTGNFKSPYIKGLLYDLEFQKVVEKSKVPLSGVKFSITRKAGGNTYSEQIEYTKEELTAKDGWIKFHDLPWGTYTIKEISYNDQDKFQNTYMKEETFPKTIGTAKIGEVINADALTSDHGSGHDVDRASDIKNRLFIFHDGTVENTPNTAKITIKKNVDSYADIQTELKNQKYTIKTNSSGKQDVYIEPESKQTSLSKLEKEKQLGHQDEVTYELIVPKKGGTIDLEEAIPDEIKNKVVFGSIKAKKDNGDDIEIEEKTQGCKLTVSPGDDLTVTITNIPVGTVKLQKIIDNYQSELSKDAFIIKANSSEKNGAGINVEAVLKHEETSGKILIKKKTTLNIEEVLPKEYSMSEITISGGGTLSKGNQVTVNPGENVTVTVHNTYSGKPFFHASDVIKNIFKWK